MEQVADNHGAGIRDIHATCVDDLLKAPRDVEPPRTFQEFYNFPELCGWEVKEDFTLGPSTTPGKQQSKTFLIQAWLFFGLVQTIVQIDNEPVLSFDELHISAKNGPSNSRGLRGELSTEKLHGAIEKWTNWEAKHEKGLRFRMIQVGWILDLARQVIQKEYAYDHAGDEGGADDDDNQSISSDKPEQVDSLHVNDKTVLVLMCLGETLSAAKARIVEQNHMDTTGWHGDDQAGWGPPKYVFAEMEKANWCPRTMEILRGQVSSNATMLVAAYQAYRSSDRMTGRHRESGCNRQECKLKSLDEKGNYQNRHREGCNRRKCEPQGPPEDEVLDILRSEENIIPLLVFSDENREGSRFEVIPYNPDKDNPRVSGFVTVSHVWSDGWGNEQENKLNYCQLRFIKRQIRRATGNALTPFWMDTLVIPVTKGEGECRKKGIRQIFDVFSLSSHTIILDNGLSTMDRGGTDKPAEAAMKIFSSIWMRRLWTLQEAYLSRKLLIPFMEESDDADNLVDFDTIEEELEAFMQKSTSGITQMIKVQLSRSIMGEERRSRGTMANKRARQQRLLKENTAAVVANAYRAARWRTTAKAEHEVLALATLLNLETKATKIEDAGLDPPGNTSDTFNKDDLEELVCVFWNVLHKQRPGAIPSGMIFLPGDKVSRRGFGWAPRTWLSAYEMDYPDPLSFWNKPTELSAEKGLRVCYPGFLLHPDSPSCRGQILGTSIDSEPFTFPVDRSLNEWYSFQRLDDAAKGPLNEVTRQTQATTQLAIILSGSSLPRESPREIALLVEVTDEEPYETSDETLDSREVEYRCSIIHRILVWRTPNHLKSSDDKRGFKAGYLGSEPDKHNCIGEITGPTQRWWVDRPIVIKMDTSEEFQPKPLRRTETSWDRMKNSFTVVQRFWGGGKSTLS